MATYEDIRSTRRLVTVGAWIGLAATAVGLVLFVMNLEFAVGPVLSMVAWVLVFATPSIWALLSLDRRPSLLPAAALGSLVVGVTQLLALAPPLHVMPALLFWLAMRQRPAPGTTVASWKRPVMAAALLLPALVMSSHLDPVCTTVAADGTVTTTRQGDGGWRLGLGASSVTTSESAGNGSEVLETTTCSSDTTVWWEGLAGVLMAVAVAAPGVRWPANRPIEHTDTLKV